MDNNYFIFFEQEFENIANYEKSVSYKKYMRNKFEFYGFGASQRHLIVNNFLKNTVFPAQNKFEEEIKFMWLHDYREMQYAAMSIVAKYQKKKAFDDLKFIEFLITTKSWWDTVDFIASNIVSKYFYDFTEQRNDTINKWVESGNIWLQRTSIIFQLKHGKNTDLELLFSVIERLKHIDEFFIQKAIGWSLRQYSKTNPQLIIDYVDKMNFSNFVNKEALKYINKKS